MQRLSLVAVLAVVMSLLLPLLTDPESVSVGVVYCTVDHYGAL